MHSGGKQLMLIQFSGFSIPKILHFYFIDVTFEWKWSPSLNIKLFKMLFLSPASRWNWMAYWKHFWVCCKFWTIWIYYRFICCPCGVMVKALDCGLVVKRVRAPVALSLSEKYPWERYKPSYPPSYGLDATTTRLELNELQRLICH